MELYSSLGGGENREEGPRRGKKDFTSANQGSLVRLDYDNSFRVPKELHHLLLRWARDPDGWPALGYYKVSSGFQYWKPRSVEPPEPPNYDINYYDRLCHVIDVLLSRPQQHCITNKYRFKMNKRQSAEDMGITKDDLSTLFEQTIKKIERLTGL
jgi:hypothetical protein